MAEERLIDDDKDRKYKTRINEDGEEVLVIDNSPEIEEEVESIEFEVPELCEDDEEAAVMTPEQLAARERAKQEAEQQRLDKISQNTVFAKQLISEQKFDDCVFVCDNILQLDRANAEAYALKTVALTADFTNLSRAEEGLEAAEGFKTFASAKDKAEYVDILEKAVKILPELQSQTTELNEKNDSAKALRRRAFVKKRDKSAIFLAASGIPMLVFAVLAIYFSTIMHAVKDGSNMVLFFVFLGVAAAFFVATIIALRAFWGSAKLVSRNEKNSSSKLGREYEAKNTQLKFISTLVAAFDNAANSEFAQLGD